MINTRVRKELAFLIRRASRARTSSPGPAAVVLEASGASVVLEIPARRGAVYLQVSSEKSPPQSSRYISVESDLEKLLKDDASHSFFAKVGVEKTKNGNRQFRSRMSAREG